MKTSQVLIKLKTIEMLDNFVLEPCRRWCCGEEHRKIIFELLLEGALWEALQIPLSLDEPTPQAICRTLSDFFVISGRIL